MPGEKVLRPGGAAAGEGDKQEVAEEGSRCHGEQQEHQGDGSLSQKEQRSGDHQAAAGQERQEYVARDRQHGDGGDESGIESEVDRSDLHELIVSNVQILLNTIWFRNHGTPAACRRCPGMSLRSTFAFALLGWGPGRLQEAVQPLASP
ncbi:hypothetical protein V1L54_13265 [Streptomyces sp. TRM 70361]|uniref:hypothetical protein n=1 Tax=Streptomyces sp. TRM 70361 TaxID=3116553 RepID=UPI002E7BB1FD|nr:hypothetical protein [Streptomyces sp. TRM 70361]MEE1940361.1 hypothetical protein [Streptomyces sp. TRM 70361]